MKPSILSVLCLGAFTVACSKSEPIQTEYTDASDVPSPSDDIDEIPLDELQEEDENREEGNANDDGGSGDGGTPEPEPTITYDFDTENSLIYVQVFKDNDAWLSGMAHNHVIRADGYSGQVEYNLDDLSACRVAFELSVNQLQVDEPGMRDFVGYTQPLADDDRATIRENMLDTNQLNAASYSTISFESTECSGDGGAVADLNVTGTMRVRGTDATLSPEVNITVYQGKLYAQATFDVEHASFGMTPYSFLGGAVRNDDPLRFTLDIVANAN
tara:strand:- start:924 stop:1739 length:816 start_codon:yes stop_codon:yes gene_type:complete